MKKFLTTLLFGAALSANAQIDINIDTNNPGIDISPMLYGIFYEDINHAADGGIYAELIRNRSFEDDTENTPGWEPYISVVGKSNLTLVKEDLINDVQHQALHVITTGIGDTDAGVMNTGFWGINAVKGREYKLSLWVKVKKTRGMYAILKGKNGSRFYAQARINVDKSDRDWQHITLTMKSNANDPEARFVISSTGNSDFYLDMVSLFPPTYKNHENGLRPDLVEMLYGLHPRFMRFPGGCFVEGQETPDNAFHWERTIGPIEERPGHWNKNWGYRTSDGLGFHEYLQLAEDLGAKPLYVTNIGIWHGGVTPVDSVQCWIDECLGALEYANGPVTSHYGAMRAANGHPEPFNIQYIEIGNENNQGDGQQTSDHYFERYKLFRNAILKKYPKMHIIGDVAAWGTDDPRWESKEKVGLVDEHYYRSPLWFAKNFKKYDEYSRSWPDVYCGEYAVTQGFGSLGNLNAALGEAVYMMGMENNSDIVKMSSYAPIFVNENDEKWRPDMIRFSSSNVVGTPSYYVQKLMAENLGTKVVKVTEGSEVLFPENAMYTPAQSFVGVGTYDTQSTYADINVKYGTKELNASCRSGADFNELPDGWSIGNTGISQSTDKRPTLVAVKTPVNSRKYTINVRAKKNSGSEGFLIVFNYVDPKNYCWFNVGGWGNSATGFEQTIGGGNSCLKNVPGHVETGRWYDITVEVNGNIITGYIDGEKICDVELKGNTLPGLFTSASVDEKSNEMVVKIVNTSGTKETTNLHFDGFTADGADLIQLKAFDGTIENTLAYPTTIYPIKKHVALEGESPLFEVDPYSLNILRFPIKK